MASPKDKKPSTTVHRSKKLSFSLFPMSMTCQSDTKVSGDPTDVNTNQMMQRVVSDGTNDDKFANGALLLGGVISIGLLGFALSGKKRSSDDIDVARVEELIVIYKSGSSIDRIKAIQSSRYTSSEHKAAKQEIEKAEEKAKIEQQKMFDEVAKAALADLKNSYQLRKPPTES